MVKNNGSKKQYQFQLMVILITGSNSSLNFKAIRGFSLFIFKKYNF